MGIDNGAIELVLPFPPSVNNYLVKKVRKKRGTNKHYVHVEVSSKGIMYRASCLQEILKRRLMRSMWEGRLAVEIFLFPPDKRRYDVDNFNKVLLDALTQAKLWQDDSQIDDLRIIRAGIKRPKGAAVVRVRHLCRDQIPQIPHCA